MKRCLRGLIYFLFIIAITLIGEEEVVGTSFSAEMAMRHLEALAEGIGPRAAGTPGAERAAKYITETFQSFGYQVIQQSFQFPYFEVREKFFSIVSPEEEEIKLQALIYSPSGEAVAGVAFAELGRREDFLEHPVRGKIALIRRGEITFRQKVGNAAEAGALAAIVYNNEPGEVIGTLLEPTRIPAGTISGIDGERLRKWLTSEEVVAKFHLTTVFETRTSANIIARWPGTEAPSIIVGGHYDSIPEGPGANDNASGVSVVLELARTFAGTEVARQTEFVAFGGEEFGLFGSRHLVESMGGNDLRGLKAMINFDQVGIGERLTVGGEEQLTALARNFGGEIDQNVEITGGRDGRSDHAHFASYGVPVLFFNRPDDPYYHTARDTVDKVQLSALERTGLIAQRVLRHIAEGKEMLPDP
ncbi:MAG: M28 family peptidase [bacterium]